MIIRLFQKTDGGRSSVSNAVARYETVTPTDAKAGVAQEVADRVLKPNGSVVEKLALHLEPFDKGEWWDEATRAVPLETPGTPPLLSSTAMLPYAAEQYRIIRTAVVRALPRPFLLAISSPGVADGKTVNAVNLAAALALTGEGRTLLIDADLRGASVHKKMHIGQSPGLAEVLAGTSTLQNAMVRFEQLPALHVLPAGTTGVNPTDQFDSPRWLELAAAMRRRFTHVVLDCPPVGLFADYDLIAAVCDGVLAVIRPGHTNRTLCTAALAKMRPKLTGVVINGAEDWLLWKKSTRKYYSHYASKGKESGSAK